MKPSATHSMTNKMLKYTELKNSNRQDLKSIIPLEKPFTVLIEPSSLCNFRCTQCFQSLPGESYFTRERQHMTMERFSKIISMLCSWKGPKIKVLKLSIYGEPLLNKNFISMVSLARSMDVAERIETTTNASLLTPNIAKGLVDAGLDYIRVSIYGANEKMHSDVTSSKVSLRSIKENLSYLKRYKSKQGATTPIVACKMIDSFDEANSSFIKEFSEVCDECYIDEPHEWINLEGTNFLENYYKESYDMIKEKLYGKFVERKACPMPFTTLAIRSNGSVSPCCVDYIGGTNIGNIDEEDLQEIWDGYQMKKFRMMHLSGKRRENIACANCNLQKSQHYTLDDIDSVDPAILNIEQQK